MLRLNNKYARGDCLSYELAQYRRTHKPFSSVVPMHKKQQMAVHEVKTHGSSSSSGSGRRPTTEIYKTLSQKARQEKKKKTSVSSCGSIFEQWVGVELGVALEDANGGKGEMLMLD